MKSLVTTIKPLVNYIIRNRTIINFTAFSHAYCLNIHTRLNLNIHITLNAECKYFEILEYNF
jgi:hypothetical protein